MPNESSLSLCGSPRAQRAHVVRAPLRDSLPGIDVKLDRSLSTDASRETEIRALTAILVPWRLLDCVERPLDVAERYLLVKQLAHRVREVGRRFTALQRLGQAPRSSLSRWTP